MRFLLLFLIPFLAYAGPGTFPQGDHVKNLKDKIEFKNTKTQIISNDSDDPTSVAKNAAIGSLYLKSDDGVTYRKTDAGLSTNWLKALDTTDIVGTDNMVPLFNGTSALDVSIVSQAEIELLDGKVAVSNGATGDNTRLVTQGYVTYNFEDRMDIGALVEPIPYIFASGRLGNTTVDKTELELLNNMVSVSTGLADNDKLVTQGYVDLSQSAGLITGGAITDNLDGTIDVAAGTGLFKTTDSDNGDVVYLSWSLTAGLTPTDDDKNWVYVDYNAGAPIVQVTNSTAFRNRNTTFSIARLWRDGTTLHIIEVGQDAFNLGKRVHAKAVDLRGYERATGLVISETGTRNVAMTAGTFFRGLTALSASALDTSGADTFKYWYRDGGGGWTEVAAQTQINNLQYDDNSGALASLSVGRYGNHWVYLDFDGHLHVIYGQGNYKLAEAQVALSPVVSPFLAEFASIIGKIIIEQNQATFESISTAFERYFNSNTAVNHNDLGGIQGGTTDEYYHLFAGVASGQLPFWDGSTYSITDTSELVWDDVNKHFGIGVAAPLAAFDFDGADIRTQRYLNVDTNTNIGYSSFGAGNLSHAAGQEGYHNTAIGSGALYGITSGYYNTALGAGSLDVNTQGYSNVAIGYDSLSAATTGSINTGVGTDSLKLATGNNNTAIGYAAGDNITSGSSNIIIGGGIDAPSATTSYQLNIGDFLYGDMTNNNFGFDIGTFEAWPAGNIAMQLGASASIQTSTAAGAFLDITQNAYEDAGGWKYQHAGLATLHSQESGNHIFYTAAVGVLDAAVTWVKGLSVDSLGVVAVGDNKRIQARELPGGDAYLLINDSSAVQQVRFTSDTSGDYNYVKSRFGLGGLTDVTVPLEVAGEAIIPSLNSYIGNGHFELNTTGWACTGALSIARNTLGTPLFGRGDGRITAAVNSLDDYCYYAFTLKGDGDNAAMLSARIEKIKTGTGYDTGDASLRLYDVTAADYVNNNSTIYASTLGMAHDAGYQTHATNTSYQLRIVSNSDDVWTFDADNIGLRRDSAQKGVPITKEEDLNITLSGFGNATVLEAKYYRVGEIMYARGIIDLGTTLPTTTLQFSLDDYTMKYTYNNTLGVALATDTGAKALPGIVRQASSAVLRFYGDTTSDNYWNNVRPFTWAAIDYLEFNFKVAIAGWQAEANMSSTTLNREIFSRYTSNAGTQAFTAVEIIDFEDVDKDKTNAVTTGAAWKFTAQEDGTYSIKAKIIPYFTNAQTSQEAALYLYKNGVQLERLWYEKFQATRTNFYLTMKGSATIPLEANDYIDIRGYSSTSGTATLAGDAAFNSISITKINSGTEKLFEDAKVVAIYETSAPGHNVVTATYTNINYGTKVEDSHNAVTVGVGAWKFTAPMDGTFQIKPTLQWQLYSGWTYNEVSSLFISKNSLTSSTITADEYFLPTNDASGVAFYVPLLQGSVDIDLLKGEYISIVGYQTSDSTLSLRASTAYNRVSITRIK